MIPPMLALIALCEDGHSYHAAAKQLGCHASMLKRAMARAGYTPRLHKPSSVGRGSARSAPVPAHLLEAYPALSVAEIAERAGVSYATALGDLALADQVLAGLRSVVDRGDANATFAAYTEGFAACLRILRDALGLDEEARDA